MVSSAELQKAISYARAQVGKPFAPGALGPDAFDCWGLVRDGKAALFGDTLPVLSFDPRNIRSVIRTVETEVAKNIWQEMSGPEHGAVVTMSHSVRGHHVGLWLEIDGGGLLHALDGVGVRFQRMIELKMDLWSHFRFYRFVADSTA